MKRFLKGLYATFNGGKYVLFTIGFFLVILPLLNYAFPALGGLDRPTEIGVYAAASVFFLIFLTVYFYLPVNSWVRFTIKKGWHYSLPRKIKFARKSYVSAKLKVTHGMLYETDITHTNKVFGFSNGIHHLLNSVRIGWRPHLDGVNVQFLAYIRRKGKLIIEPLSKCKPGNTIELSVSHIDVSADGEPSYIVTAGNVTKTFPAPKLFPVRYYLWPYFGGKPKAPHTITLELMFHERSY